MPNVWDLFEQMNEVVFVSAVDDQELVYMNARARAVYGIPAEEPLQGRKCYLLLHGYSAPCSFCSKRQLMPGQYEERRHYDPSTGKSYLLKLTPVEQDGRLYYLHIIIDISPVTDSLDQPRKFIDHEAMLNEALRISLSSAVPIQSIHLLLDYLGKTLHSDRTYIFEGKIGETFSNTYEWCAEWATPQKDNLQKVPYEVASLWCERFRVNQNIIIRDLEDIRESDPVMYDLLLPQQIHSLVACPLTYGGELIGFYGVDNPPQELLAHISTLLQIMGHFIVSLLRRRAMILELQQMSYYDQLTGCQNRHALTDRFDQLNPEESVGILYGDVTGLKRINDAQGHAAGDRLLVQISDCLRSCFSAENLYRVGGDEFLVLVANETGEQLQAQTDKLRADLATADVHMAIGCTWHPQCKMSMDDLIREADAKMYEDKRRFYATVSEDVGKDHHTFGADANAE
jgi:diguanylate cyclase (GGDEF)-like protein